MDIQLSQQDDFGIDINVVDGQLVVDDGLETAVLISLLTDALARDDDALPIDSDSVLARQGWWGTELLDLDSGILGSRLWLNSREKIRNQSIERIRENAVNSLEWLLSDGIAQTVDVSVERQPDQNTEDIAIDVRVTRPEGNEVNFRFSNLWDGVFN